jgi:hypothetical protein
MRAGCNSGVVAAFILRCDADGLHRTGTRSRARPTTLVRLDRRQKRRKSVCHSRQCHSCQEPLLAAKRCSVIFSKMGRPHRAAEGGYVYHVLNRANARMRIFKSDADYKEAEQRFLTRS